MSTTTSKSLADAIRAALEVMKHRFINDEHVDIENVLRGSLPRAEAADVLADEAEHAITLMREAVYVKDRQHAIGGLATALRRYREGGAK